LRFLPAWPSRAKPAERAYCQFSAARKAGLAESEDGLTGGDKEEIGSGSFASRRASAEPPGFSPFKFKNPGVFLPNFNFSPANISENNSEKQKCEIWRRLRKKVRHYFASHPAESL